MFELAEGAKVLHLREPKDLTALPIVEPAITTWWCLDFEQLRKDGWDAVEVEIGRLYWQLYGWDCDSILIMNPEVIVV